MKNFTLCASILFILPITLFGQLQKGTWLLGGTGRLDVPTIISYENPTGSNDTYSYYEMSLAPTLGYFLSNRFMIGVGFGSYIRLQPDNGLGVRTGLGNVLPQVRYYFNPSNTKRNWFALAEGNFDVLRLGGGVNYFLSPSVALEGFAGVNWNGSSTAELNTNIGLQFFLKPNREKAAGIIPALDKGTVMLGGSGSISTWKGETWRFHASPNVGYFLSKRLVLGGRIEANYSMNNTTDYRFSLLGISPFIRYYLNPERGRLLWFLMADAGVGKGFSKVDEDYISPAAYNQKYTTFSTSGRVGIDYFFTPRVALEGMAGIHYSSYENNTLITGSATSNTFRIGADIGIQFFLSRK